MLPILEELLEVETADPRACSGEATLHRLLVKLLGASRTDLLKLTKRIATGLFGISQIGPATATERLLARHLGITHAYVCSRGTEDAELRFHELTKSIAHKRVLLTYAHEAGVLEGVDDAAELLKHKLLPLRDKLALRIAKENPHWVPSLLSLRPTSET